MEQQALLYLKQMLDKATQKGAFTLDETANETKEDGKEEN